MLFPAYFPPPERDCVPRDVRDRVPPQPGAEVRGELLEGLQDQLQGEAVQLHPEDVHDAAGQEVRRGDQLRELQEPAGAEVN